MESIGSLTSEVTKLQTLFNSWNYWSNFFIVIFIIAGAVMYFAQYKAKEYAKSLSDAKDRLNQLHIANVRSGAETKIAEVKAESEKTIMMVKTEADKRIALLTADTERARKGVAIANEKTEAERLERLKLEESLEPRGIMYPVNNRELKWFAGAKVFIEFGINDAEAGGLAHAVAKMLIDSGWIVSAIVQSSSTTVGDVEVFTKGERTEKKFWAHASEKLNDAAETLVYQLKDNELNAIHRLDMPPESSVFQKSFPSDTILIKIGPKPQPYREERLFNKAMKGMSESVRKQHEESRRKRQIHETELKETISKEDQERRAKIAVKYGGAKDAGFNFDQNIISIPGGFRLDTIPPE